MSALKAVHEIPTLCLPELLLPGQRMRLSLVTPEISNCLRSNLLVGVLGTRVDEVDFCDAEPRRRGGCHKSRARVGDASRWSATLRGGRVFERQGERPKPSSAVTSSEVRWRWTSLLGLSDELSARRSPSRAVELASRELGSLVGAWLEERMLIDKDLGEMPPADRPSERALWVAALLNPCGADRQAWPVLGIRPAVLTATTPMERALGRQDGDGRQHVQAQGRLMADEHVLLVRWRASAVACPPGKPRRE